MPRVSGELSDVADIVIAAARVLPAGCWSRSHSAWRRPASSVAAVVRSARPSAEGRREDSNLYHVDEVEKTRDRDLVDLRVAHHSEISAMPATPVLREQT